jgi:CheY-like chemotaxis protein
MPDESRYRVGILDDNSDSRVVLRYWLETQGFDVQEYSSKQDFVEGARDHGLNLGLVDIWLPEGSGFDVPSEVKDVAGTTIPLVAVTADAMPAAVKRAEDAGFSGFLSKPLDFDKLHAEIRKHLP